MWNEVVRNFSRIAINDVENARRKPGVQQGLGKCGRRGGRVFGWLGDNGAADGQRSAKLAHQLRHRKIPRRERRDRTHRLLEHHLGEVWRPRGDDLAIGALAFAGEPVEQIGRRHHLGARLGKGLAHFHRHARREGIGALAQQHGRAAQDAAARIGTRITPGREGVACGLHRLLQIDKFGHRILADHFRRRRIVDGHPPP